MDNSAPIVPTFNGQLAHGAAALCDFFLIMDEAEVPVAKIIIMADEEKYKVAVGPGKYKTALFLLYCAVLEQSTSFLFDADLQARLGPYFGDELVADARLPETKHQTLQPLVLGTSIEVNLVLKPGYELPKNPGRTIRKLIEHGWNQRESRALSPDTPMPLIRQALKAFLQANRDGTIHIIYSWDSRIWPSNRWADQVRILIGALGMNRTS